MLDRSALMAAQKSFCLQMTADKAFYPVEGNHIRIMIAVRAVPGRAGEHQQIVAIDDCVGILKGYLLGISLPVIHNTLSHRPAAHIL